MTEDSRNWQQRSGAVEETYDGSIQVFTWFEFDDWTSQQRGGGVEMARFDPKSKILSIFPKKGSNQAFDEQFGQIRELRIGVDCCDWDSSSPVGEGETGELELVGLPEGFGKVFAYGLGLRKNYRGIVHAVESATKCSVICFRESGGEGLIDNVFYIEHDRFTKYKRTVDLNRRRGNSVVGRVNKVEASNVIADLMGKEREVPPVGRNPIVKLITREVTDDTSLDPDERSALLSRTTTEAAKAAVENPRAFGKLREDIDLVTLEVLIDQFDKGLRGPMASSESKWQEFFETNTFALQQLFAAPVAMYGHQLNVRMPNVHGGGGRITDFVLVNTLTRSAVVVEIKTPSSPLVGKCYRGAGGAEIFPPHKELSGAVAQLQAQMESALTDFRHMLGHTSGAWPIETSVLRGAVIVGTLSSLDPLERQSFMRYRNGLQGIEVVTFDEVRDRLKGLHEMLAKTKENADDK